MLADFLFGLRVLLPVVVVLLLLAVLLGSGGARCSSPDFQLRRLADSEQSVAGLVSCLHHSFDHVSRVFNARQVVQERGVVRARLECSAEVRADVRLFQTCDA